MSERRRIFSGTTYEDLAGYARAVVDGDWVHVSGTTGIDPADGSIPEGVVAQTHQIFRNIEWALGEAGSSLNDVVRIRVYLDNPEKAVLSCFEACPRRFNAVVCGWEELLAEELEDVPRFGEMLTGASDGESDLILDARAFVLGLGQPGACLFECGAAA